MDVSEESNEISSISGRTTVQTEQKSVEWVIEHFSAVVEQRLPDVNFTFDLGYTIGVPCTWNIKLKYDMKRVDIIVFEMSCINQNRPKAKIIVNFDTVVTYDSRLLHAVKNERTFAPLWIGFDSNQRTDDIVTIKARLTLYANQCLTTYNQENNAILKDVSNQKMVEDMQQLLDSGHNSDFVIKVPLGHDSSSYESFNVHKNILATRSEVFKAMLESPMQESLSGEAMFDDLSPAGMKIFLKYLYTGIVDDDWKNRAKEVVDVADRFSFPTLKKFVDMNLHLICNVENAVDLLQMATLHGLKTAFKRLATYIKSNAHDITEKM